MIIIRHDLVKSHRWWLELYLVELFLLYRFWALQNQKRIHTANCC